MIGKHINTKGIFVTGGSGYVGAVVVKWLIERGYDVAVFNNFEMRTRRDLERSEKLRIL